MYAYHSHALANTVRTAEWARRIVQQERTPKAAADLAEATAVLHEFAANDLAPVSNWSHFRGHHATIPEPIGRYAGASYHERAQRLVFDASVFAGRSWEDAGRALQGLPEFHADHLAAMIADEATRAARAASEEQNGETTSQKTTKPTEGLTGEEKALATLVAHPDWSDTKIAKHIGCHRTTLYKWPKYIAAREALDMSRSRFPRVSRGFQERSPRRA
ncbi:MAG: hypothetical protein GXX96_20095 [Planctomycetaceae bacterium]|jgi:hypothetical protein|nr:hypothetical protein [Planctomycetaceae bacterium]